MAFIINYIYTDDWADLTLPDTKIDKIFTTPVLTGEGHSFEIVFSAYGRHRLVLYDPDGVEAHGYSASSVNSKRNYVKQPMTSSYSGTGTDWTLRCERYSSVNDDPLPQYKLHQILMVDDSDSSNFDAIAQAVSLAILAPLWQSYKEGTVMFSIPSANTGAETPVEPDPTHYHYISGNVKKLDLAFEANVVAVSIGLEPKVLAASKSDALTGDYRLDVYPYADEVILYVAPDYGVPYVPSFPMFTGQIVHPITPNKYVYVAQNDGALGVDEPNWPTEGEFNSGTVTLTPVPLYRPLANGFVKPNIVAI
jgi:hypothetical protein